MDYSDFVGVGELSDLLGVTPSRIVQLRMRDDFPRPLFRLRATPVWSRREINAWADARPQRNHKIATPSSSGPR